MKKLISLVAVLAIVAGACGDDDAATTTTGASAATTVAQSTSATTQPAEPAGTTTAPIETTQPTTTTTTAPATTTTGPTTTMAADAHQSFGGSWSTVWPADGATAMYRVEGIGGDGDLPAVLDYDIEFQGETFDRLTVGTPTGGSSAMVVYFDRSEPWVVAIKAVETYDVGWADGPLVVEWFDTPLRFDANGGIGEATEVPITVNLDVLGDQLAFDVVYSLVVRSITDTIEVPFGTLTDVAHVEGSVTGEDFVGPNPFIAELWLHPEQFLVRLTGSPAFDVMELLEGWE